MSKIQSLEKLVELNEYPIVFIGSGITKRYLKEYPGWVDLLKEIWDELDIEKDFFAFLNQTRNDLKDKHPQINGENPLLEYETYIKIGTIIEEKYNKHFYNSNIKIDGFDQREAFYSNISPFKKALSLRFGSYLYKEDMLDEIKMFKKLLHKAQVILTTNYDTFLEDCYSNEEKTVKKFVGQKGFFQQHSDWAELYKIHGCVTDPNSIIISQSDYDLFNQNSVLISAKIISLLINSELSDKS